MTAEPETGTPAAAAAPPPDAELLVRTDDADVRWFVVHTLTGHEQKVKAAVERGVGERGLESFILHVLVPAEEVARQGKGAKGTRKRIFFPGYVLVQMKVTEKSWGLVRHTTGVTGFVGSGMAPVPLADDEVRVVLDQIAGRKPQLAVEIDFEAGDAVNITSGPFANFAGVVEEVYPDRGKCKVMVTIFGRATAVELDVGEVTRVR